MTIRLNPVPQTPLRDDPTQDAIWKRFLQFWIDKIQTAGTGTVTSVAQSVPTEFAIAGSPITTSGTLAITKQVQNANKGWFGPTTGADAQPTFRALVAADIPSGAASLKIGTTPITSGTVGRLLYEGASNLLQESANLSFDGTTLAVTGLAISAGTVTASTPGYSLTQTWNNVLTSFVGADTNITDTASAANSRIVRWRINGVEMMALRKDGNLIADSLQVTTNGASVTGGVGATLTLNKTTGPAALVFQNNGTETGQIDGISGGGFSFFTGTTPAIQVAVTDTPSATRQVTLTGSNGGNPTIGTSAGDLAVSSNLVGAGLVQGSTLSASKGASTSFAAPLLNANVNTSAVGNVGGGEDNLITYSLPASSLSAAGKGVRVTAWGIAAANGNSKTLNVYFGSTVATTTTWNSSAIVRWKAEMLVFSTGTDAQTYTAQITIGGTTSSTPLQMDNSTSAQDDGAGITIKCTGTATTDNDIVQQGMFTEFIN